MASTARSRSGSFAAVPAFLSRFARPLATLVCCASAFSFLAADALAADAQPAVSAKQALQIAEEALTEKGVADSVYVASLALQTPSVVSRKAVWTVLWSSLVPAVREGSWESGLQISMDGSVVHLVKKPNQPALPHEREAQLHMGRN